MLFWGVLNILGVVKLKECRNVASEVSMHIRESAPKALLSKFYVGSTITHQRKYFECDCVVNCFSLIFSSV